MSPTFHKKQLLDTSCYDLTLERLAYVFDSFDRVAVSFSGGKDSTACLNLALQMARERKRLPLDVYTFDEEAIPPETVEYLARIADQPDIRLRWYCAPIQHRNACSTREPYWWCWAPEARDRWTRDLPTHPTVITEYPGMTRANIVDQMPALFSPRDGTLGHIMGIRSQESLSRFAAIAMKTGFKAFMSPTPGLRYSTNVYPIYDWATEDVWRAPQLFGWDYNRAYDTMEAAGVPRHLQRCAPPFGEQPIRALHNFKTCWPALWSKMVARVDGAATAARYANTELYGFAVSADDLPAGLTWREWTMATLRLLEPHNRAEAAGAIRAGINTHRNLTSRPVPDTEPDPESGFCWRFLYTAAKVGGNKFGRVQQKIAQDAIHERIKRGVPQRPRARGKRP